jgi:hypothetical protein
MAGKVARTVLAFSRDRRREQSARLGRCTGASVWFPRQPVGIEGKRRALDAPHERAELPARRTPSARVRALYATRGSMRSPGAPHAIFGLRGNPSRVGRPGQSAIEISAEITASDTSRTTR